jgi:hypothetical protein
LDRLGEEEKNRLKLSNMVESLKFKNLVTYQPIPTKKNIMSSKSPAAKQLSEPFAKMIREVEELYGQAPSKLIFLFPPLFKVF